MTGELASIIVELMVLNASGEMQGRTRLQKTMFLLQSKYGIPLNLNFEPYFYGPYSEELAYDIEILKSLGIVSEKIVVKNNCIEYIYTLTAKGKQILNKMLEENQRFKQYSQKILQYVNELNKLPLKQLVAEAKSFITTTP